MSIDVLIHFGLSRLLPIYILVNMAILILSGQIKFAFSTNSTTSFHTYVFPYDLHQISQLFSSWNFWYCIESVSFILKVFKWLKQMICKMCDQMLNIYFMKLMKYWTESKMPLTGIVGVYYLFWCNNKMHTTVDWITLLAKVRLWSSQNISQCISIWNCTHPNFVFFHILGMNESNWLIGDLSAYFSIF